MNILREGAELTVEFRVLRLLSNINSSILLSDIESIEGLTIKTLADMRNKKFILIENDSIKITEIGMERYEKLMDDIYVVH